MDEKHFTMEKIVEPTLEIPPLIVPLIEQSLLRPRLVRQRASSNDEIKHKQYVNNIIQFIPNNECKECVKE